MNKDNAAQYLPLVQALADGREIQVKDFDGKWHRCVNPKFDAVADLYRIKPEVTTTKDIWVCVEEFNGWRLGDLLMNEPGLGFQPRFRKTSVTITVEV